MALLCKTAATWQVEDRHQPHAACCTTGIYLVQLKMGSSPGSCFRAQLQNLNASVTSLMPASTCSSAVKACMSSQEG